MFWLLLIEKGWNKEQQFNIWKIQIFKVFYLEGGNFKL